LPRITKALFQDDLRQQIEEVTGPIGSANVFFFVREAD